MKFSKKWSKLNNAIFTTIRKNSSYYEAGSLHEPITFRGKTLFYAKIVAIELLKKIGITEELARMDADMSRAELITFLEKMYGAEFDDFILITLHREVGK